MAKNLMNYESVEFILQDVMKLLNNLTGDLKLVLRIEKSGFHYLFKYLHYPC